MYLLRLLISLSNFAAPLSVTLRRGLDIQTIFTGDPLVAFVSPRADMRCAYAGRT